MASNLRTLSCEIMTGGYKTKIVDLDWLINNIPCRTACPIKTEAWDYVQQCADGDFEGAYSTARAPNPLVYVHGRVCAHPCETACRRGKIDDPIAICALKRAATDRHDLKGLGHNPSLKGARPAGHGEKVAVIGAGPAGLACAHDLALMGYRPVIFEASPVPGGMLHLGLPPYRLPRDIISMEIEEIKGLGVEFRTNTSLGKDIVISDIWTQGFKAVFIAIGAHKSRDLRIEGADLDGVLKGVDFLLNINLGYRVNLGQRVIVVGGGNVAIDVARSALRQETDPARMSQEEMRLALESARLALRQLAGVEEAQDGDLTVAMDVARSALRMGVKEVHMVCLEARKGTRPDNPREEMPAHTWEIEEAEAEGLQVHASRGPKRILGREGRVTGFETIGVKNVYDSEGRFNPSFIPGTEGIMECDTVILAIGQASDLTWVRPGDGIEMTPRNTIKVDRDTLATTAPGIFAGGDLAFGPRLIVDAVADGHKAAQSMDSFLKKGRGRKIIARMKTIPNHRMHEGYLSIPRQSMPTLPTNRRIGMAEVELGYDVVSAQNEGKRCLRCQINPIFNGDLCIACGGCVDVCPEYCFKMVKPSSLEPDETVSALVEKRYGRKIGDPELDGSGAAMLMDPEKCIRCGACARRCPTGAITMEAVEWEEIHDTIH